MLFFIKSLIYIFAEPVTDPGTSLRPIIHVRNRSLDEVGRFSTMSKKKDSYRDAIFNQSKWLINLSMDAEAKNSLSKGSSRTSSTDNLLRKHNSDENLSASRNVVSDTFMEYNRAHPPGRLSLEGAPQSLPVQSMRTGEDVRSSKRNSHNKNTGGESEQNMNRSNQRSSKRSLQKFSQKNTDGDGKNQKSEYTYDHRRNSDGAGGGSKNYERNQSQRSSWRNKKQDKHDKYYSSAGASMENKGNKGDAALPPAHPRGLTRNHSAGDVLETDIDEIMGLAPVGSTKKRKEQIATATNALDQRRKFAENQIVLETDLDQVMKAKHKQLVQQQQQQLEKHRKPVSKRESYKSAVNTYQSKFMPVITDQYRNTQGAWGGKILESNLDESGVNMSKQEPVRSSLKKKRKSYKVAMGNRYELGEDTASGDKNNSAVNKGNKKDAKKKKKDKGKYNQMQENIPQSIVQPPQQPERGYHDELEYLENASRTRDSYYAAVNTASESGAGASDFVNSDQFDDSMPLGTSAATVGMYEQQQIQGNVQSQPFGGYQVFPTSMQGYNSSQLQPSQGFGGAPLNMTSQQVPLSSNTQSTVPGSKNKFDYSFPASKSESQLKQHQQKIDLAAKHLQQIRLPIPSDNHSLKTVVPPPKPARLPDEHDERWTALQRSKSGPALNLPEGNKNISSHSGYLNNNSEGRRSYYNVNAGDYQATLNNKPEAKTMIKNAYGLSSSHESSSSSSQLEQAEQKHQVKTPEYRVLKSYGNLQDAVRSKRPWETAKSAKPVPAPRNIQIQTMADLEKWNSPSVLSPPQGKVQRNDQSLPYKLQTSLSVGDMLSYGVSDDFDEGNDSNTNNTQIQSSENIDSSIQAKRKLFEQQSNIQQHNQSRPQQTPSYPYRSTASQFSPQTHVSSVKASSSIDPAYKPSYISNRHEEPNRPPIAAKPLVLTPKDRPHVPPKPKQSQPSPKLPLQSTNSETEKTFSKDDTVGKVDNLRSQSMHGKLQDHNQDSREGLGEDRAYSKPLNSASSHNFKNYFENRASSKTHSQTKVIDHPSSFSKVVSVEIENSSTKPMLSPRDGKLDINQPFPPSKAFGRHGNQASDNSHSYVNMKVNSSSELIESILPEELSTLDSPARRASKLETMPYQGRVGSLTDDQESIAHSLSTYIPPKPKPRPQPRPQKSPNVFQTEEEMQSSAMNLMTINDGKPHNENNEYNQTYQKYGGPTKSLSPRDRDMSQSERLQLHMQVPHSAAADIKNQKPIIKPRVPRGNDGPNTPMANFNKVDYSNLSSKASIHSTDTGSSQKDQEYVFPDPASEVSFNYDDFAPTRQDYESVLKSVIITPEKRRATIGEQQQSTTSVVNTSSSSSETFQQNYIQMSPSTKMNSKFYPIHSSRSDCHPSADVNNDYINITPGAVAGSNTNTDYVNVSSVEGGNNKGLFSEKPQYSSSELSPSNGSMRNVSSPVNSTTTPTQHSRQSSKDSSRSSKVYSPVVHSYEGRSSQVQSPISQYSGPSRQGQPQKTDSALVQSYHGSVAPPLQSPRRNSPSHNKPPTLYTNVPPPNMGSHSSQFSPRATAMYENNKQHEYYNNNNTDMSSSKGRVILQHQVSHDELKNQTQNISPAGPYGGEGNELFKVNVNSQYGISGVAETHASNNNQHNKGYNSDIIRSPLHSPLSISSAGDDLTVSHRHSSSNQSYHQRWERNRGEVISPSTVIPTANSRPNTDTGPAVYDNIPSTHTNEAESALLRTVSSNVNNKQFTSGRGGGDRDFSSVRPHSSSVVHGGEFISGDVAGGKSARERSKSHSGDSQVCTWISL